MHRPAAPLLPLSSHACPTIGDTQSVLEVGLDPQLGEPDVDFRAASMHQHGSDAHSSQQHQVRHDAGLTIKQGMSVMVRELVMWTQSSGGGGCEGARKVRV